MAPHCHRACTGLGGALSKLAISISGLTYSKPFLHHNGVLWPAAPGPPRWRRLLFQFLLPALRGSIPTPLLQGKELTLTFTLCH